MRKTFLSLALAAGVTAASALYAQEDSITIPDGSGVFELPPTFGEQTLSFSSNDVSRTLAENAASVYLDIDGFLSDLEPYYFNLDEIPESIEARELVMRAYLYEYYARLFPEGSEQYRIAKNVLNGDLKSGGLSRVLTLALSSEHIGGLYPFKSMFEGIVDSELLDCGQLSEKQTLALEAIVQDNLDALIFESLRIELIVGILGEDGFRLAVESAQNYRVLEQSIFDELEKNNVGFELPDECLEL